MYQFLPVKSRVIVTVPEGEFKGVITAAGTQAQVPIYAVMLDDSTGFVGIPEGEKIVVVPVDRVKFDQESSQ